jgi:hypothetical protein
MSNDFERLDFSLFQAEVDRLIKDVLSLYKAERLYVAKLTGLQEERRVWQEQRDIATAALAEMDGSIHALVRLPNKVSCPTCGSEFRNSISAQFELIKDYDSLVHVANEAKAKLQAVDKKVGRHKKNLDLVEHGLQEINNTLSVRKNGVKLDDIVKEKGRIEVECALRTKIIVADTELASIQSELAHLRRIMELEASPEHMRLVSSFFFTKLQEHATYLDVVLPEEYTSDIMLPDLGRGSATPRALFAYYLAVIASGRKFKISPQCPIVVDSPNQQGQDTENIKRIMDFVFNKCTWGKKPGRYEIG